MDRIIRNSHHERITYLHTPGTDGDGRLVVIGHGLTSDKVRPWSEALSARLAGIGIASLRIAFTGNGESGGRFEDSNITKEVGDLGAVLDAVESAADVDEIVYVGHSMGAAVGVIRAAADSRIRALVSLAGMVHTREFVERMFEGVRDGEPMLGKPDCPMNAALRADLREIESVQYAGEGIDVPWLIVHGTSDDVVPMVHATDMHRSAPPGTDLVMLDDVDHSFTGAGLESMTRAVVDWIDRVTGTSPS